MATSGKVLSKVLRSTGGEGEFKRKFQEYNENLSFIDSQRIDLLKEYDEKWIAVYGLKVVASSEEYEDTMKDLKAKGVPIDVAAVKFLTSRNLMTLFTSL